MCRRRGLRCLRPDDARRSQDAHPNAEATERSACVRLHHDWERGRNRRRRNEFVTTNTLENAIAAPAMTGDSRPDIASGMAATLYANAQNRLPLIVPSV